MTGYDGKTGPRKLAAAARAAGVADLLLLDAMRHTSRALFVPAVYADRAYDDWPVPIRLRLAAYVRSIIPIVRIA